MEVINHLASFLKHNPLLIGSLIGATISAFSFVIVAWLKFRYDELTRRRNKREESFATLSSNMQAMIEWSSQTFVTRLTVFSILGAMRSMKYDETPKHNQYFKYTVENYERQEAYLLSSIEKFILAKCEVLNSLISFDIYFENDKEYKIRVEKYFNCNYHPLDNYEGVTDTASLTEAQKKDTEYKHQLPKNPFVEAANSVQDYIIENKSRWLKGKRHKSTWLYSKLNRSRK